MQILHKLSVDLQMPSTTTMYVKQGDKLTRYVELSLHNAGSEYTPANANILQIVFVKPDRTGGVYDTMPDGETACTIEGNVVTAILHPQMFTCPGVVKCELRMLNNEGTQTLSTFAWLINVEPSGESEIASESYYRFASIESLASAIGDLDDLKTQEKNSIVGAINEVAKIEVVARAADGYSYSADVDGLEISVGTEIILIPQSTNFGAATLQLNGGEAYPLCLRPGWNVTGNDLRPQLAIPLEAGSLLRGGEYVFRFDGAAWVLQSYISDQKAAAALNKATTAENTANAAAEDAEEARLLAEDAEQTAITAISMGNHVIRASTSDGVSYVAPRSDTLPAITTGTAGGHEGKGTRIVLIPSGPNTAESPTLKIGAGEAIPIRLRSAANKGDNDQVPDATDDVPVGAMMAGVPYAMTFCGKYWLIDSLIGGIGGGKVYVSDTMPDGLRPGDSWVDTSEELENPVTQGQMETYVNDAIAAALDGIALAEEGVY